MAVGDDAATAGYAIVPDTGEEGRVRFGAREINRTRDYIAVLKKLVPSNKSDVRKGAGITSGTAAPTGGDNGDIYFQVI